MADDNSIVVSVCEIPRYKHFQMQYLNPGTGRKVRRSTGVERDGTNKAERAAKDAAAVWQAALREGRYRAPNKITWADFRVRYENEVLKSQAEATAIKAAGIFNTLEEILNPAKLIDLTAERLSHYQAKLRDRGHAASTTKVHLAYVRAALNWANRMGLLAVVPNIEKTKRAKGAKVMKGRPITREEFERMLAKVPNGVLGSKPKAYAAHIVESWRHYLEGLWTSGLRLAESLELTWDRDDKLCVDLTGKRPMLRIPAELEKGNEDRLLPMAPEFAEFLLQTPEAERTGFVFNPLNRWGKRAAEKTAGPIISDIGKLAVVKVNTDIKSGKVKYASAHDLRRSFGERWASRVMPQVLMELMRHESMDTTLRFYVGRNAQATAETLWAAHKLSGDKPGDNAPDCQENGQAESDVNPLPENGLEPDHRRKPKSPVAYQIPLRPRLMS
jgi:site-specific recombinase XerD